VLKQSKWTCTGCDYDICQRCYEGMHCEPAEAAGEVADVVSVDAAGADAGEDSELEQVEAMEVVEQQGRGIRRRDMGMSSASVADEDADPPGSADKACAIREAETAAESVRQKRSVRRPDFGTL